MPPSICPITYGLFVTSTITCIYLAKRRAAADNNKSKPASNDANSSVGSRGVYALTPILPYLSAFFMCLENPCDPETNPEGHIALCVAENTLVQEMLANRLMKPAIAAHAFGDSVSYCYNGMLGLPVAREAVAYFLARRFLLAPDGGKSSVIAIAPTTENVTSDRINPEHVAIGAGAASILNNLFFILAEKGAGVLVPAPFYAAFVNDMRVRFEKTMFFYYHFAPMYYDESLFMIFYFTFTQLNGIYQCGVCSSRSWRGVNRFQCTQKIR